MKIKSPGPKPELFLNSYNSYIITLFLKKEKREKKTHTHNCFSPGKEPLRNTPCVHQPLTPPSAQGAPPAQIAEVPAARPFIVMG